MLSCINRRCLSKRKDTNFKANHNTHTMKKLKDMDVCLSAKIRILKQITTMSDKVNVSLTMFV